MVNSLDFEKQRSYELIITATDSISGVYAEVPVSILVEDANDCYPVIEKENYNVTLPENTFLGSQILKINATDCDFGANSVLSYVIESINGEKDSNLFYIDISDGALYLKHQLNYEDCKSYLIVISVNDHGTPSLRSRTNVWIEGKLLFIGYFTLTIEYSFFIIRTINYLKSHVFQLFEKSIKVVLFVRVTRTKF